MCVKRWDGRLNTVIENGGKGRGFVGRSPQVTCEDVIQKLSIVFGYHQRDRLELGQSSVCRMDQEQIFLELRNIEGRRMPERGLRLDHRSCIPPVIS